MIQSNVRETEGWKVTRTGIVALALGLVVVLAGCSGHTGVATSGSATPTASISEGSAGQLPGFPTPTASPTLPGPSTADEVQQFIAAVFADAQREWQAVFSAAHQPYTAAKLVQFSSAVNTACGTQPSTVGPFYCPADHTVYLDVEFFDEMEQRYGVAGDFAQAYVVAHEVGHHIQAITGLSTQVAQAQQAAPSQANRLSVLTELQADCYAGVWAHSTYQRGLLEPGDIDEALAAASAVGDDFLQASANDTISPELWTHGSSAQRQQWLTTGYETGSPAACNTFA